MAIEKRCAKILTSCNGCPHAMYNTAKRFYFCGENRRRINPEIFEAHGFPEYCPLPLLTDELKKKEG